MKIDIIFLSNFDDDDVTLLSKNWTCSRLSRQKCNRTKSWKCHRLVWMYSSRNIYIRHRSYIIAATTTARICDDVFKSLLRLAGHNSYGLQCMDWDDTPRSGDSQLCLRLSLGELWRHIFSPRIVALGFFRFRFIFGDLYFYPCLRSFVTYRGSHSEKTLRNYRILFLEILCESRISNYFFEKEGDLFLVMIFF